MKVDDVPFVQGRNARSPATPKYAIAIHNTSNNAPAASEALYAKRREDGIGAHFYGDGRSVIQSIDTSYYCWHAGSSNGNHNAVAVELTGTNPKTRQWWIDNIAWDKLGSALAEVCRHYDIPVRRCTVAEMKKNPRCRGFYSHNDMRLAWGGTTHDDPGDNFPWDYLFNAVNKYLNPQPTPTPEILRSADMQMLVRGFDPDPEQVWLVDGMHRRKVKAEWIGNGTGPITNAQVHQAALLGNLAHNGEVFTSGGDPDVWGKEV